ncbi:MAG: NAD-dependent epimerase/dehydratase family protein [Myxococcales bacterium]|nr:NAD-dependent epimerase/dehydratase family protein [Myxococcales bacterium]
MSGRSVLVTGGAGFIGSHVGERFAQRGDDVRVLDDLSTGLRSNCDAGWRLFEADVRDPAAVREAAAGVDLVLHFAAFTSVPESFERTADCRATNVAGTRNVLDACAHHGVQRLVFASTCAVYGELPEAPKAETERPEPRSPYAVSKLEGERLLEEYARAGVTSTALRLFNVYGPRQLANSAYAAAIPIFMERGLQGQALTIYGDGHQKRDFVFVSDVAEAFLLAASSSRSGVYNVGTGRAVEILELANAIAALTEDPTAHHFVPTRPGDARTSAADITRIREALDWSPTCTLERGLSETLKWYRRIAR